MTIFQKPMLAVFAVVVAISGGSSLAQTAPSNARSLGPVATGTPTTVSPLVPDSKAADATAAATSSPTPAATTNVTTTGGTANYLSRFNGTSTVVTSSIYDDGTFVGIGIVPSGNAKLDLNGGMILRGPMTVARLGNGTPTKAFGSNPFNFYVSAYSSSSGAIVNPYFRLQSEPVNNNTATPSATFNLLYAPNGGTAAETGFYVNTNGIVHFASGQTFSSGGPICIAANGGFGGGGETYVGPNFGVPAAGSCAPWAGFTKAAGTVVLMTSGSACVSSDGLKMTLSLSSADPAFLGTGSGSTATDYLQLTRASTTASFTTGTDQGYFAGSAVQTSCTASLLQLNENND